MSKNKAFFIGLAAIFLTFNLNNISFAIEDTGNTDKYPNYDFEFNGKDTCEKFNRKLFVFNLKLNKYVLRPLNTVWASVVPQYGMDRIKSVYNNINYPVRVTSCLLEKDFKAAKQESVRFLTNTTLGFGGLYDPAKDRFKIEPRQEDIEQVLAHYKVKPGPYLVLPVVRGHVRDLAGQLLDCPFNPCSYVLGPFAAVASAVFFLNNTTGMQTIIKRVDETYADPYKVAKQADGVEHYIKNENLDRAEVFREKAQFPTKSLDLVKVNSIAIAENTNLLPDVKLNDFNSQSPLVDSMRTALFDKQIENKSIWSEVSLWNRGFGKKFKFAYVNMESSRPNYKYRYIMQPNKNAPIAIIYSAFGEGIMCDHATVIAKILYDEGYSVAVQGSAFQWEFVKSMPSDYKPGLPNQDAKYLRTVTSKILADLQKKYNCNFEKRILVGSSFGALTGLFVAAQEAKDNTLNISNYIAINPPVEILYSLKQLDNYCVDWKNNPADIKLRAAITAEKVLMETKNISNMKDTSKMEGFSFKDDEAKLIIGFVMKQKLSDVIFAIENGSRSKKNEFYNEVTNMSFADYAQKYLFSKENKTIAQYDYESSLFSIADFLKNSKNYKIYHTIDDYFANPSQLSWLKMQTGNKSLFFSNGSHLGFLYRKEFIDDFKKATALVNDIKPVEKPDDKLVQIRNEKTQEQQQTLALPSVQ